MSALRVVPADLAPFAAAHGSVAEDIGTALTSGVPAITTMPATYGPVGADFVTAVDAFDRSLLSVGTALHGGYGQTSQQVRVTAAAFTTTDADNSAALVVGPYTSTAGAAAPTTAV